MAEPSSTYASRLATFSKPWPHLMPNLEEVAAAGFSQDDSDALDGVTCDTCLINLCGWKPSFNPLIKHLGYSRTCSLALSLQKIQEENIQATQEEASQASHLVVPQVITPVASLETQPKSTADKVIGVYDPRYRGDPPEEHVFNTIDSWLQYSGICQYQEKDIDLPRYLRGRAHDFYLDLESTIKNLTVSQWLLQLAIVFEGQEPDETEVILLTYPFGQEASEALPREVIQEAATESGLAPIPSSASYSSASLNPKTVCKKCKVVFPSKNQARKHMINCLDSSETIVSHASRDVTRSPQESTPSTSLLLAPQATIPKAFEATSLVPSEAPTLSASGVTSLLPSPQATTLFTCKQCKASFPSKKQLRKHHIARICIQEATLASASESGLAPFVSLSEVTTLDSTATCPHCQQEFTLEQELQEHLQDGQCMLPAIEAMEESAIDSVSQDVKLPSNLSSEEASPKNAELPPVHKKLTIKAKPEAMPHSTYPPSLEATSEVATKLATQSASLLQPKESPKIVSSRVATLSPVTLYPQATCRLCKTTFASKNKLHEHIRSQQHASHAARPRSMAKSRPTSLRSNVATTTLATATPASPMPPQSPPAPPYRALSPPPPMYRSHLTVHDLYMRYAPLKTLCAYSSNTLPRLTIPSSIRPLHTRLPKVLHMQDLQRMFQKPANSMLPKPCLKAKNLPMASIHSPTRSARQNFGFAKTSTFVFAPTKDLQYSTNLLSRTSTGPLVARPVYGLPPKPLNRPNGHAYDSSSL